MARGSWTHTASQALLGMPRCVPHHILPSSTLIAQTARCTWIFVQMAVLLVPTSLYLSAKDTLTHNRPQLSPLHGECAEVEGDQDLAEHLSEPRTQGQGLPHFLSDCRL